MLCGKRTEVAIVHVDTSFACYVLGRAGFGASPSSLQELQAGGFPSWVESQLAPQHGLDTVADERLRAARLHIKYPAGDGWAATDEARPLATLDAPIDWSSSWSPNSDAGCALIAAMARTTAAAAS